MVSVLVVNWNTRDLLLECLASIAQHADSTPHEVIVVDNASSDGSAEAVRRDFPAVKLVASSANLGYAAGNNRAASLASGDFLLTLNPDTKFVDDALAAALGALVMRPNAGCVGARLLDPDGSTQRSVRGLPTLVGLVGAATGLDWLFPRGSLGSYFMRTFAYDEPGPAPQPMGTFLMFRRAALATVGDPQAPFDERFPIFFNEVDLLARLAAQGWDSWYDPSIRVVHHGAASTRQVRRPMIWESHRSLFRFLVKHTRGPARALLPFARGLTWLAALIRAQGYSPPWKP